MDEIDWAGHHALAKNAAAESMVLLKNSENTLPLKKGSTVAVVGTFAKEPRFGGGGSSGVRPKQLDAPYDFIAAMADVSYAPGYDSEEPNPALIEEACRVSRDKDAVIVMVGTTSVSESEGADRRSLALPASHLALLESLAKANTNIVVCNFSGAAVELAPVAKIAKAILHCGLPGEAGGSALAELLFGDVNPSGKLSETFPVCLEQTPAYPYFPGDGDEITYVEGLLQGYRYYDTKKIPPQYPFGYGLSYTEFTYSNLRLSNEHLHSGERLVVSLDVTNCGKMAGSEIVQVYVCDPSSYLIRPEKELKGFARVTVQPGETRTVDLVLDERAFAYYVPHLGRFAVESGVFKILVAASSRDIRLEGTIQFHSSDEVRRPLTLESSMAEFYNDDRYSEVTRRIYAELQIGEDHPIFPVLSSLRLKFLPEVLAFIQIPPEVSVPYQQCILNAASANKD